MIDTTNVQVNIESNNEGNHRVKTFRYLINNVLNVKSGKLVDLGAGPCIFAKIARDVGFNVTAVDGRDARVPSNDELGSIQFVKSDVREFDVSNFDIVLILGLLYHFDVEDQISLLKKCNQAHTVIIDTQFHDINLATPALSERSNNSVVERLGYQGIEFFEANNPMASIGNSKSFWHTEKSLLKLFEDCAYHSVTLVDPVYVSKYGARRFYLLT
ncbi:class I SAM-dependent methyltransferase [Limnospira platensis]|uniref:class I SAM-dependent methyltransferase n=1 Tax=Limnospira platensis TaxID=118562 RepID=UPI00028040AE|nr:methyltransferase [Arthrospira platensis C1]UWU47488.1 Methyltransferase domain-containing protein [Arthrospira platensis C1]